MGLERMPDQEQNINNEIQPDEQETNELEDMQDETYDPDDRIDVSNLQEIEGINEYNPDDRIQVQDVDNSNEIPDNFSESVDGYQDEVTTVETNPEQENVEISDNYLENEEMPDQTDIGSEQQDVNEQNNQQLVDDNGKLVAENGELIPNNEYTMNNYLYRTDGNSRIISAEGKLQAKDHQDRRTIPSSISVDTLAKGDQKLGDERGHIIADQFNGKEDISNLTSMNGDLNKKDFAKLENKLAAAVKSGADVYYKVEPIYTGSSHRPSEYKVSYSIDGDKNITVFKNGGIEK